MVDFKELIKKYVNSYPDDEDSYRRFSVEINNFMNSIKYENKVFSKYLHLAWEMADLAECEKMHFGAVITLNDEIIGFGYNHPANEYFKKAFCEPICYRIEKKIASGTETNLCAAYHAEQTAIKMAIKNGFTNLSKAIVYVGGKYPDSKGGDKFYKTRKEFYCPKCAIEMGVEKINNVHIATKIDNIYKEMSLTMKEVSKTAIEISTKKKFVDNKYSQK